ncbi:MAG: sigma-70 family RNA polymerase sigma factor, partial [Gemmataceae bacterium]|nr:sigma-70 family RNA polymerase sigma factor [Gemmataceae bacterium]
IMNEEMDPRLRPREGASDIVQNAFLQILENLQRGTHGIFAVNTEEEFRRWLREVGLNALSKEHRDEGREMRDFRKVQPIPERFDQPAGDPTPSSIMARQEQDLLLEQAVNALPESDRMLLRLRVLHGWKHEDLAELLDGHRSDAGRKRVQRRLTELLYQLREVGPVQDQGS